MAFSTRTMRIVGATLIAVVLIGGAYFLSGPNPLNSASASSTEELLRAYAAKDSDSDGLPDWEEGLYGTDPQNAHSVQAELTDRQAVDKGYVKPKFTTEAQPVDPTSTTLVEARATPGTLTERFSQQLFSTYLRSRGGAQPADADIATYAQKAVEDLLAEGIPNRYSNANLKILGTGSESLRTYAAAAERAYAAHTTQTTKSDLSYYTEYLQKSDKVALKTVSTLATTYTSTAKALLTVSVPTEAAYAHLELVNAMANKGEVLADMAAVDTDPLRAYVGIAAYSQAEADLMRAFSDMRKVFAAEQVSLSEGESGYFFFRAMSIMAEVVEKAK